MIGALGEWAARLPRTFKRINDMTHHANQLFALVYPVIPEGCFYVNVYVRLLHTSDAPVRREVSFAFHGDDPTTAEEALTSAADMGFAQGVCFGREIVGTRRMAWHVMDAFSVRTDDGESE